jgi:hypothetical protein
MTAKGRKTKMKFSVSQIQFLMTKMTISDVDAFNVEASQFVPVKPKKTRVVKPVSPGDLCVALKKDGNACCNKKKVGDLCGRHAPKTLESSVSEELVGDSGSERGSERE